MCPIRRTSTKQPDEARAIRRAAADGRLAAVARGAYVDADRWADFTPEQKHVVRIQSAANRIRPGWRLSHLSAAALLTLPSLGGWPPRVHVMQPGGIRSTANRTFVLHADLSPDVDDAVEGVRSGLVVTGLVRTAVDLAMTLPFRDGVVALDRALELGADRDAIAAGIEGRSERGRARARRVVEFADGRADSVAESLARVLFDQIGAPRPVLQHRFRERDHPDAIVDFWFPDQSVIVEFDGELKYRDAAFRDGRSPAEVVVAEKYREDRLRARSDVRGFVRLRWRDLFDLPTLIGKLRGAGIPVRG
jgi:hypothetical protein